MAQFNEEESNVARHYDEAAFQAELTRLPQDSPVEMGVTLRWLGRVAKAGDVVAEIGVGGGHYTEFLARAGCRLHLVDISARLLDAVEEKLTRARPRRTFSRPPSCFRSQAGRVALRKR